MCFASDPFHKRSGPSPVGYSTVPRKGVPPAVSQVLTFIARRMVSITKTLAHSVDSLVRVPRRLVKDRVTLSREGLPAEKAASQAVQTDSIYLPGIEAGLRRHRRSLPGHPPRTYKCTTLLLSFLSRPSTATFLAPMTPRM